MHEEGEHSHRSRYTSPEERRQAQLAARREKYALIKRLVAEYKDKRAALPLDPVTGTIFTQEETLVANPDTRKSFIAALLKYHYVELKEAVDAHRLLHIATYGYECLTCGRHYLRQHSGQKYCSSMCRDTAAKLRYNKRRDGNA